MRRRRKEEEAKQKEAREEERRERERLKAARQAQRKPKRFPALDVPIKQNRRMSQVCKARMLTIWAHDSSIRRIMRLEL
jgi:hypothetical protein